jgi:DnaK suppressor protein
MDAERARALLERERTRIEKALADLAPADTGELSNLNTHLGDEASELYEDERDEGLSQDLREQLAAVQRAEQRLADGTFVLSIESGEPIPDARLEAQPTAERTVEEQSRYERGG